jgi:lipoprotein NlpI
LAISPRDWNYCKQTKDLDASIAACTKMLEAQGETVNNRAIAYTNRGKAYFAKGNEGRAFADYTQAIDLNPLPASDPNSNVYLIRGFAFEAKGDEEHALADYDAAIRLDPYNATAYVYRGQTLNHKGEHDRAIADCTEALRLDPKNFLAYDVRGKVYEAKGDGGRATTDFIEAIRLNPTVSPVAVYIDHGKRHEAKGDHDRSIVYFSAALRSNSNNSDAYFLRGLAYLYAGAPARALADLDLATEFAPRAHYPALWLDIISKRSNLPSRLLQAIKKLDMVKWPAPLIRLFLGQLTAEAVLVAADNPNAGIKNRQVCEANFYSAELALQDGAKDEAHRLFQIAATNCPKDVVELRAAKAELKVLSAQP